TESPIKYVASASSSSSYTSPQAAQTNTPARTRKRPVPCRTGSGGGPPPGPPPEPQGPPPGAAERGGAGACGSITLRRYVTPPVRIVTHTCGAGLLLTDSGMSGNPRRARAARPRPPPAPPASDGHLRRPPQTAALTRVPTRVRVATSCPSCG